MTVEIFATMLARNLLYPLYLDGMGVGGGGVGVITFSVKMTQCFIRYSASSCHFESFCFISFREYDC